MLLVMTPPVYAGDWRELCGTIEKLATTIMKGRQSGMSMAKMMEITAEKHIEGVTDLLEKLIIAAYDSPRYNTKSIQKRTVEEFRDKVYLKCVKSIRTRK